MFNFDFYNPTHIVFGKDRLSELNALVPKDAKVLITYGGGSAVRSGLIDRIVAALGDRKVEQFGGIEPNPSLETCERAVAFIKEHGVDFVLAVGGGSVVDATKLIVMGATYDGPVIDVDFEEVKDVKTDNSKGVEVSEIYEAKDASGNTVGYTLKVLPSGYGGTIELMVGIDSAKGQVSGINVVSNSETAGLGMRAGEVLVPQFSDKNVSRFTYTKTGATADSEIDAISGATITTNAVVNGVNAGLAYFDKILKGGSAQ